ncbi:MAG: LysM peptidoglycan-binding domain-containing protein [Eubacteriales bacterium]
MRNAKRKLVVKSKFRFTIFITVMILFSTFTLGTAFGVYDSESLTKPLYYQVQIQTGDTLWEIAQLYGPKDQDIRKSIFDICQVNNISAEQIYPGQLILVPREI